MEFYGLQRFTEAGDLGKSWMKNMFIIPFMLIPFGVVLLRGEPPIQPHTLARLGKVCAAN